MEVMMRASDGFLSKPEFGFEAWRVALRPEWGRYTPEDIEPETFASRVRSLLCCGFEAIDLSCNAHRVERTQRDARVDGVDHFYAVFQVAGRSMMIQNDQAVKLSVGDAALVDSARPVTYVSESSYGHFALQLPRRSLVSHLGFEPQDGFCGRCETRAGRLLFQLVLDAVVDEDLSARADAYMQLAIYDLLGALFAPSGPVPVSLHADKLFRRICGIIKDRFADPEFGPCELAAEAGISLRYVRSSLRR